MHWLNGYSSLEKDPNAAAVAAAAASCPLLEMETSCLGAEVVRFDTY